MPNGTVITFAAAILERDDLLVLALFDYLTSHSGAFDQRRALLEILAVTDKKHIAENTFLADLNVKEIDLDDVAFGNAVLSAA